MRIERLMSEDKVQKAKVRIDAWTADKVEQGQASQGEVAVENADPGTSSAAGQAMETEEAHQVAADVALEDAPVGDA